MQEDGNFFFLHMLLCGLSFISYNEQIYFIIEFMKRKCLIYIFETQKFRNFNLLIYWWLIILFQLCISYYFSLLKYENRWDRFECKKMRHIPLCSKAGKKMHILKKEKFPKGEIANVYLLVSVKYYQWSLLSLNICWN